MTRIILTVICVIGFAVCGDAQDNKKDSAAICDSLMQLFIKNTGCPVEKKDTTKDEETGWDKFFKNLQIRKGFETEDDKVAPAIISLTFPKDSASSFLFNGGISYKFKIRKQSIKVFGVYNRNTLTDKEQNNWKLGLTSSIVKGDIDKAQFVIPINVSYKDDKVDTTRAFLASSYLNLISVPNGIGTPVQLCRTFSFKVTPSAGLEYQYAFGDKAVEKVGATGRVYYSGQVYFTLCAEKNNALFPALEFVASHTGRYDVIHSTALREGFLALNRLELDWFPALSRNFSIGASYNYGADPIAGLPEQQYYLIAAKVYL